MQILATPQVVSTTLSIMGVVVALVLVITRARGRSRIAGIVAAGLMLLGILSGLAYLWLLASKPGQLSDEALISIVAARTVIESVLSGLAVILFSCAIIVARRWPTKRKHRPHRRTQPPSVTPSS